MINFKQKELIQNFFSEMQQQFPDTEFVSVTEGPENPADLWINITALEDEDIVEREEFTREVREEFRGNTELLKAIEKGMNKYAGKNEYVSLTD